MLPNPSPNVVWLSYEKSYTRPQSDTDWIEDPDTVPPGAKAVLKGVQSAACRRTGTWSSTR